MNIKKFRRELGLTQQELADEIGISRISISDYERGKTEPPLFIIKALKQRFTNTQSKLLAEKNKSLVKENKILKEKIKFLEKKLEILEGCG